MFNFFWRMELNPRQVWHCQWTGSCLFNLFQSGSYLSPGDLYTSGKLRPLCERAFAHARESLWFQFKMLTVEFLEEPESLGIGQGVFDPSRIDWMKRGVPGHVLNRYLGVKCYGRGETVVFAFSDVIDGRKVDPLTLPINLFFATQFYALSERAALECNYWNRDLYAREIYRPLLELVFLLYSFTDPLFSRRTRLATA